MLDPPPFDFEHPDFTSAWFLWHNFLIRRLAPSLPAVPNDLQARLERALNQGHRILFLKLNLEPICSALNASGLSSRAWTARFLQSMKELSGDSGASWKSGKIAHSTFVLPGRLDPSLLLHQIEKTFSWPDSIRPEWQSKIISKSDELAGIQDP